MPLSPPLVFRPPMSGPVWATLFAVAVWSMGLVPPTRAQLAPTADVITQEALGSVVEANDQFGHALSYGFIEGGQRALLIGSWRETLMTNDGLGSESCGLAHHVPIDASGPQWAAATGLAPGDPLLGTDCDPFGDFGSALALGDFNGDGFLDSVVGGPSLSLAGVEAAGVAIVHYGAADGPTGGKQLLAQESTESDGLEVGDQFGASFAVGRFNDDAYDDLVVASPQEDLDGWSSAGMLHVYYGGVSGLSDTADEELSRRDDPEFYGFCGSSLSSADFDGDGRQDLAVGCWGYLAGGEVSSGAVYVLWGQDAGLALTGATRLQQDDVSASLPERRDRFGLTVLAADLNGDGFGDLAIGTPSEDDDLGASTSIGLLHLVFGSDSGIDGDPLLPPVDIWEEDLAVNTGIQSGDRFAERLVAGDFDGDGVAELVVGAFFDASPGGLGDSGAAWVFETGSDGPQTSSVRLLTQGGPLGNEVDGSDLFAHGLAAGDLNGDGADELLLGAPQDRLDDEAPSSHGLVHVLMGQVSLFADGFESQDTSAWSSSVI